MLISTPSSPTSIPLTYCPKRRLLVGIGLRSLQLVVSPLKCSRIRVHTIILRGEIAAQVDFFVLQGIFRLVSPDEPKLWSTEGRGNIS